MTKNTMDFRLPNKKNKVSFTNTKPLLIVSTFQDSLRVTLLIGQAFALIPVNGVSSKNAAKVKFHWLSWKCCYVLISLAGQVFMTAMCIYNLFAGDTSLKAIYCIHLADYNYILCGEDFRMCCYGYCGILSTVIFYCMSTITLVMFIQIARSWPTLALQVAKTEELDPNYDKKLTFKCNVTCAVVLFLALTEHLLSLITAFSSASTCLSNSHLYEGFVKYFYPWVFNFVPYSTALGILTQFFHFQSTFIWNFSDLFVICMSYYLTSRLEHINKKLLAAQGKYLPVTFWKAAREEYTRATQLVRKIDDVISGVVFISFANNLFFICLQLFNSLDDGIQRTAEDCSRRRSDGPLGGHEAESYFLFSLSYLIGRSIAVSLIASQVHIASTVPAPVLYDVPSPVYCVEVQRFLDHVNGSIVALSGLQFFNVTRGLLLTVAGTIVTYELVMFQFSSPTQSPNVNTSATMSTMSTNAP